MSTELENLIAKQAITDILHRYCRAVDRIDRELGRSCWHDGATVDYGDAFRGLATDFIDWVCAVHEQLFVAHSHQVTNVLARVDGPRAVSESYVTVALRTKGPVGEAADIVGRGRYLDRWSQRHGGWAIDHRRHVTDLRSVRTAGGAGMVESSGWRYRADPSYELLDRLTKR